MGVIRRELSWLIVPHGQSHQVLEAKYKRLVDFTGDPQLGPWKCKYPLDGRTIWVYRNVAYSTAEDLDAEAVEALISSRVRTESRSGSPRRKP